MAIAGGLVAAEDRLAFVNQNGITGNYNTATGVLTLTGTASVANYQTALRSVTYENSNPNASTATRMVAFQVDDGRASDHASNTVSRSLAVSQHAVPTLVNTETTILMYSAGQVATAVTNTLGITAANGALVQTPRSESVPDSSAAKIP